MTTQEMKELLEYLRAMLSEHCDFDADEDNPLPEDTLAHTHGLCVRRIDDALVKLETQR